MSNLFWRLLKRFVDWRVRVNKQRVADLIVQRDKLRAEMERRQP